MFSFAVRNPRGEVAEFLGQGETVAAAFSDGIKNVGEPLRPKNDGKHREPQGARVTLPSGKITTRTLKQFEGAPSEAVAS